MNIKAKKTILPIAIAAVLVGIATIFLVQRNGKNRFRLGKNDIEKIDLNIKIERFDQDIFHTDTTKIESEIARFRRKYGEFFDIYAQRIMEFGDPEKEEFAQTFRLFLRDSVFHEVYAESEAVFADVSDIEAQLTTAFRYIKHYFPEKSVPRVMMHVSGFNQQVVVTDSVLSVSIDNYLGEDYIYYQNLVFGYQLIGMTPKKVPSDCITVWLMSEFPKQSKADRLIDVMLHRGKIMYLLETFMPGTDESTLMAYTPEQTKWCYENEREMWTRMMEEKHLFRSERMLLAKYINEAPSTAFFPEESPGRAGIWIGWQIVRSYMKRNPNVTLRQLMENEDSQQILERSGYDPR